MKTSALVQKDWVFMRCEPIIALTVVALLTALTSEPYAAETPARPTLNELKPLMAKTAAVVFKEANEITVTKTEVIEIGAPGWAPLTEPNNEDVFWPVKVKCTVTPPTKGGSEEVVLIFRVYRGEAEWKADTTEVFTATTPASIRAVFKARQDARKQGCIANLRQIDAAKALWAFEKRKQNSDTPAMSDLAGPNTYMRASPVCPDGGNYTINPINKKPRCSVPGHEFP